jgi:hypothetical protein
VPKDAENETFLFANDIRRSFQHKSEQYTSSKEQIKNANYFIKFMF